MLDWVTKTQNLIADDQPLIIVTVLKVRGSAPCSHNGKMLYYHSSDRGQKYALWGSVGGGLIEHQVCQHAGRLLEQYKQYKENSSPYHIDFQNYLLHAESGQCCGGEVKVCFEFIPQNFHPTEWLTALTSFHQRRQDAFLLSARVGNESFKQAYSEQTLAKLQEKTGDFFASLEVAVAAGLSNKIEAMLASVDAFFYHSDEKMAIVVERLAYSHILPVMLFGCGHIARALVPMISQLPVKILWVDDRPQEFELCMRQYQASPLPNNVTVFCQDFLSVEIPANAYCLVITYSHRCDYEICKRILSVSRPLYLGLIGSKMKARRFKKSLQQEDTITPAVVDRLSCPIGEVCKTQKSPAAIAIVIANHLLQQVNQSYDNTCIAT